MSAIFNFGNPNLFVQGVVEQTMYDPATGNIVGFDKVGNDAAINYTFEFSEITGGFANQLVGLIPNTTRLTGTYTSAAFSLGQRALLAGSDLSYNGVAPVCETITASGTTLTVSRAPSKSLAQPASDTKCWCQVREHGAASFSGKGYSVDAVSKEVTDFTAVSGTKYDVTYFTAWASAQQVGLSAAAKPSVVSIQQRWGVYSMQNGSKSAGTLAGYLYVVIPLAQLEGDAGMEGNQTTNSTTPYNWRALSPSDNIPVCDICAADSDNYGYYVYVPCADSTSDVQALVVIGGTLSVSDTAQIPVKYLMPNDTVVQPTYTEMTYTSEDEQTATVDANGVVTKVKTGNTQINMALKSNTALTAVCDVECV